MKKQTLSFLLAAALAIPGLTLAELPRASAQDRAPSVEGERCRHGGGHGRHGRHRGHDVEQRLQHMTERLGLDENQQVLVRQALEQARSEREALRASASPGERRSPERREAHRALMQRTMERIDAVLTPEQRATVEQMRARRMEHRGQHGRRGPRGGAERGAPGAVDPRGI